MTLPYALGRIQNGGRKQKHVSNLNIEIYLGFDIWDLKRTDILIHVL